MKIKGKTDPNAKTVSALAIVRFTVFFCTILSLILFTMRFPAYTIKAKGNSMEPVIASGDYAAVNRMAYLFAKPERYDVIAFISPKDGDVTIKRIIGLPGETVEIKDGAILINGEKIDTGETHQMYYEALKGSVGKTLLTDDEYYVLGDALSYSEDSRSPEVGPVHEKAVIGRVWLKYRPPLSFSVIRK